MKLGEIKLFSSLVVMMAMGAQAVIYGTGANQFTIDFVNIGSAGNVRDISGYGAVDYNYRIATTEVSIDQYHKADAMAGGMLRNGFEDYWNSGVAAVSINAPVCRVGWHEAAMFANVLTSGRYDQGAYLFSDPDTLIGIDRDAAIARHGTVYVIPTEDEWYKAAYYKPINDGTYSLFANGLDTAPTWGTDVGWNFRNEYRQNVKPYPKNIWEIDNGGEEQNGTYNMMGNVWELTESAFDGDLDNLIEDKVIRGGSFGNDESFLRSSSRLPFGSEIGNFSVGFRVAAIPEPSSVGLIFSTLALFVVRRNISSSSKYGVRKMYIVLSRLFAYFYMQPATRTPLSDKWSN